ncbi:MAG: hypothetical protein ACAH23_07405, partial [Nitrososphaeraceae archaeon]
VTKIIELDPLGKIGVIGTNSLGAIHYRSLYQIFFFSSVFFNPHDRHLYDFILAVSFSHIKFSPQHGHFIVRSLVLWTNPAL